MPTAHLTDIAIRSLAAPETGQVTYTDETLPGFGVRVSSGGARTFVLVHGIRRERITLGRYPIISLSKARTEAKRILAEETLRTHTNPTIRFKEALDLFFSTHCDKRNKQSTAAETKRLLNRHFLSALQRETLEEISPQLIARIVDRLSSTPGECNHAFTAIRTFSGGPCVATISVTAPARACNFRPSPARKIGS
jgi:hypothetical protein